MANLNSLLQEIEQGFQGVDLLSLFPEVTQEHVEDLGLKGSNFNKLLDNLYSDRDFLKFKDSILSDISKEKAARSMEAYYNKDYSSADYKDYEVDRIKFENDLTNRLYDLYKFSGSPQVNTYNVFKLYVLMHV